MDAVFCGSRCLASFCCSFSSNNWPSPSWLWWLQKPIFAALQKTRLISDRESCHYWRSGLQSVALQTSWFVYVVYRNIFLLPYKKLAWFLTERTVTTRAVVERTKASVLFVRFFFSSIILTDRFQVLAFHLRSNVWRGLGVVRVPEACGTCCFRGCLCLIELRTTANRFWGIGLCSHIKCSASHWYTCIRVSFHLFWMLDHYPSPTPLLRLLPF